VRILQIGFLAPTLLLAKFTEINHDKLLYPKGKTPTTEAPASSTEAGGKVLGASLQTQSKDSLSKPRELAALDACWWGEGAQQKSFAATIDSVVARLSTKPDNAFPEGYSYTKTDMMGIPTTAPATATLSDFKLCENQTQEDLKHILGSHAKNVDANSLLRMNQFSARMNAAKGSTAKAAIWSQFMGCLSEQETFRGHVHEEADTYAGVPAPPGVQVGHDSDGGIKAGIYQFTVNRSGSNLFECYHSWNQQMEDSTCQRDYFKSNIKNEITTTGQAFNIYCGTHKVLESLFTQAHTETPKRSSRQNQDANGKLVPASDRCVSPFSANSYQHFGPLRSSTSNNLDQVLACLEPNIDDAGPATPVPESPVLAAKPAEKAAPPTQSTPPESNSAVAQQKEKNSKELAQIAVMGFGCKNYQSKIDALLSAGGPLNDYVKIMAEVNASIAKRCGKDKSCGNRMSGFIEPLIAEATGQGEPNNSTARAHDAAQQNGYRCRI